MKSRKKFLDLEIITVYLIIHFLEHIIPLKYKKIHVAAFNTFNVTQNEIVNFFFDSLNCTCINAEIKIFQRTLVHVRKNNLL